MSPEKEKITYISGRPFRDVTNETCGGFVFNYAEAVALAEGRRIATGAIEKKKQRKNRA